MFVAIAEKTWDSLRGVGKDTWTTGGLGKDCSLGDWWNGKDGGMDGGKD